MWLHIVAKNDDSAGCNHPQLYDEILGLNSRHALYAMLYAQLSLLPNRAAHPLLRVRKLPPRQAYLSRFLFFYHKYCLDFALAHCFCKNIHHKGAESDDLIAQI